MKNKLERNLLIGFSVSLVILIISSVASYFSINNLLNSTQWVNHTYEVIQEINALTAAMTDAETMQRGYLLTGENEFLNSHADAVTRARASFDKVSALTHDNNVQQKRMTELNELMNQRFHYLQISLDDKQRGEKLHAENLFTGKEIMEKLRVKVASVIDQEKELLAGRTESMNVFARYTPPLIIAGAIIALIITVSFYAKVRGDFQERTRLQAQLEKKDAEITERIRIISGVSEKVSRGEYSVRIDEKEQDTLGSVSVSLNKMAESLEYSFAQLSDKEWMQTGLARLNDTMIGEKTTEQLAAEVIDFLATYTESQSAAFYIMERDELIATAGYAYVADASRKKFRTGEGLVGQAIATGKILELKNLSPENIYISFTAGQAKPNHVIAVPVFDGYQIRGAVELATLGSYTTRQHEFLKQAAPNIGIAISTAQNRKRLQELLEETQSQSEELKAQHNELENINSELEIQSEKLQASEEELKVQQEELRQANHELEERSQLLEERNQMISERNLDIQRQADQLAQSTKYKSEFLANMSHELRTPLNSILLLSRLMSDNPEKNLSTDQIEYARVIQSSGHGLLSLIDEILDLSKIEAGKMQLEYQSVQVQGIVSDMVALFRPLAEEKKIKFETTVADGVPGLVETDKLRLGQVLKNLLSNAIKFTAEGCVTLSVRPDDAREDHLRFSVTDTGIGIAAEKQALVFEAFQQADGSTRRKYGGTGLGLSISRELVKLLGGEITVTSEAGQGSEFSFYIPLSREVLQRRETIEKQPDIPFVATPEPVVANQFISTVIPQNIPDDRHAITKGDRVILIIEDDTAFGKSLLDFTRKKGYKGIVAVRGDEGIDLARQFMPVGILLDLQLPVKSGWQVMDELKSNPQTRHIPVHIMSSYASKNESLMKGAIDFIDKPVAAEQLQEIFKKIEYVLQQHPKKVLIVEENARHAKALAYFLETFELNLEITSEVNDAIVSLKDQSVNCVILDMGIPDQKAYDTLEVIRKTPGLENLPIIIFTGKSLSQGEQLKIKQYADSVVIKTAHSYKRILDEVSLFLHLMEKKDEPSQAPRFHKLGMLDDILKNKVILVADDDMRNVFSLTKALEKYQVKVIPAVDGKDALQKLNTNPDVDIVLMDMMMPEMDGYESTRAIRQQRKFKNLPIIAVTAKAMMGDREKCINAGASDYITKPVDVDQLFSLLRVWLYEKGVK